MNVTSSVVNLIKHQKGLREVYVWTLQWEGTRKEKVKKGG